jgi:hypothetical protein
LGLKGGRHDKRDESPQEAALSELPEGAKARRPTARSSDDCRAAGPARVATDAFASVESEDGDSDDEHFAGDPDLISELIGNTEDFDITFHTLPIIYDKAIRQVQNGSALVVQHLQESGDHEVLALYLVRGTRHQREGLLIDAAFIGSSDKSSPLVRSSKKGFTTAAAPLHGHRRLPELKVKT